MVDIARLGIEIDTRGLRAGERDLNRFGASASSAASATNTATRAVTSLVGALAVGKLIEMADSFAMMTARISRFTEWCFYLLIFKSCLKKIAILSCFY